jgi:hypothetical protein
MSRIMAVYTSDDAWVGGVLLLWGVLGLLLVALLRIAWS